MTAAPPWSPGSGSFAELASSSERRVTEKHPSSPGGVRQRYRIVNALLVVLIVLLVTAAGLLAWKGLSPSDAVAASSAEAPLPEKEFVTEPGDPVGPTGEDPVAVGDDQRQMTVHDMEPGTLFIPALGVYMPIEESAAFDASRYADFDTLRVPTDALRAAHYAAGAPLAGGAEGTTLVAAHVSTTRGWGALRYLYTLSGGELLYTKDGEGVLQEWQLTQMRVEQHTDFPQEFWSAEGPRQLVVTTCGGPITRDGHFRQNIFAIATPVDPEPTADDSGGEAQS